MILINIISKHFLITVNHETVVSIFCSKQKIKTCFLSHTNYRISYYFKHHVWHVCVFVYMCASMLERLFKYVILENVCVLVCMCE